MCGYEFRTKDRSAMLSVLFDALVQAPDGRQMLLRASEIVGRALDVDRCIIIGGVDGQAAALVPVEWTSVAPDPSLDAHALSLAEIVRAETEDAQTPIAMERDSLSELYPEIEAHFNALGIGSLLAAQSSVEFDNNCVICVLDAADERLWSSEDIALLERAADLLGMLLCKGQRELSADDNPAVIEIRTDSAGRVTFASAAVRDLTGLAPESIQGERIEDLLGQIVVASECADVIGHYRAVREQHILTGSIQFTIRHTITQEERCVLNQVSSTPNGIASTAIDITFRQAEEIALQRSEARYRRLVEHSDAIIFHTDDAHVVNFASRRAMDFFGIAPEDFVSREKITWFELIHQDDRERIETLAREVGEVVSGFDEEFRVVNRVTDQVRWLLVRLMPVLDRKGKVQGWDGFGVDITGRREAQDALVRQSKKVRALYTVSAAIRGYLDPGNIAARGLHAMCDATGADAGACYLFSSSATRKLKLVAHDGLSEGYVARAEELGGLSTYVATHGQAIVVPDLRKDPRASRALHEGEGLRSAVLVPISVEDEVLGTLSLFSKEVNRFDGGDVMLVSAASNQIGLAARQATLFAAYRKQARNLSALYRASHELSRNLSLDEIFNQAFSIIRDELGLKRLWLGLLNDTGTRLTGQAAYGAGLKRRLIEMNVPIAEADHPIAHVVRTQQPSIINVQHESLKGFGLQGIFSRLDIDSVALVPLISSGQTLGVLAVEPEDDEIPFDEDALTLLRSLASEIAAVLLAKRFEERAAEAERMRTAGHLAAGISHNFNNLLQAILGQASLLEMQRGSEEKIGRAAKLIHDAATKGAGLVKQLMSFAQLEQPRRELCDVNYLVESCVTSVKDLVGPQGVPEVQLGDSLPRAYVDPGQLRQVLSNILLNANDAVNESGAVSIRTDSIVVDEKSRLFEVPFGHYLRVTVHDDGFGMDEETKKRCVEPFFTTKNVDPASGLGMSGTGLGLAAAYALTRRNGGNLVVESQPGQGTTVSVYLPVYGSEDLDSNLEDVEEVTFASESSSGTPLTLVHQSSGENAKKKANARVSLASRLQQKRSTRGKGEQKLKTARSRRQSVK